jgi:alpha-tubulin suppressor-like RCC1 family protein
MKKIQLTFFILLFNFFLLNELLGKANSSEDCLARYCEERLEVVKNKLHSYLTFINYLEGIESISQGYSHNLLLTKDGQVYVWGWNTEGQLGLGDNGIRSSPTLITKFKGKRIISISTGKYTSYALDSEGNVYSWGYNSFGNLGLGDIESVNIPTLIPSLKGKFISFLSCGPHCFAIDDNENVYSWGNNSRSQLGLGDEENRHSPTLVEALKGKKNKKNFSWYKI